MSPAVAPGPQGVSSSWPVGKCHHPGVRLWRATWLQPVRMQGAVPRRPERMQDGRQPRLLRRHQQRGHRRPGAGPEPAAKREQRKARALGVAAGPPGTRAPGASGCPALCSDTRRFPATGWGGCRRVPRRELGAPAAGPTAPPAAALARTPGRCPVPRPSLAVCRRARLSFSCEGSERSGSWFSCPCHHPKQGGDARTQGAERVRERERARLPHLPVLPAWLLGRGPWWLLVWSSARRVAASGVTSVPAGPPQAHSWGRRGVLVATRPQPDQSRSAQQAARSPRRRHVRPRPAPSPQPHFPRRSGGSFKTPPANQSRDGRGSAPCSPRPAPGADPDKGEAGNEVFAGDSCRTSRGVPATPAPRSLRQNRPPQTAEGVPGHAQPLSPCVRCGLGVGWLSGPTAPPSRAGWRAENQLREHARRATALFPARPCPGRQAALGAGLGAGADTAAAARQRAGDGEMKHEVLGRSRRGSWVKQLVLIALCQACSRSKQTQLTKKPAWASSD